MVGARRIGAKKSIRPAARCSRTAGLRYRWELLRALDYTLYGITAAASFEYALSFPDESTAVTT